MLCSKLMISISLHVIFEKNDFIYVDIKQLIIKYLYINLIFY